MNHLNPHRQKQAATLRVLSNSAMQDLFAFLYDRNPIMAPRERATQPGFYSFDWVDQVEHIALQYSTTTIPPKKAFFAPVEALFEFDMGSPPEIRPIIDRTPFVLAGVHPCDLAAIEALDLAYSEPPVDSRWQSNRRRAFIIGIDCMPDEYCFCTSLGTSEARGPCDLFLTAVDNGWLVECSTSAGENVLQHISSRPAHQNDIEEAKMWLRKKEASMVANLDASISSFAEILDSCELTEVWREVAERCYSCGSCNTTCPACFCFSINDRFDLTLTKSLRERSWDSCQLLEFALVAGRHTHPIGMVVGGFSFVHDEKSLDAMRIRLQNAQKDLADTVQFFQEVRLPEFMRETEYISLMADDHYAFYRGDVHSSRGVTVSASKYRDWIEEYVSPYSTAKPARRLGRHYMVGALARYNNNYPQLSPSAKLAAQDLSLPFPCSNPFAITFAQIVECVQCVEESMAIIDELLEQRIKADAERAPVNVRAGLGVGAVEAPRGILFHEYEFDSKGVCRQANLVIPTAQNVGNLEDDMRSYISHILAEDQQHITHQLEMLVRAYDPCISCSVHVVKLGTENRL